MNKGKCVFSQVIDFFPRYEFDKIVKVYNGDYRYKHLTSYNHLFHLMFGQLTGCSSLQYKVMSWALRKYERGTIKCILRELLTKPIEKLLNQNQNVKELNLFEF